MNLVSEPGVYKLIFKSRKTEAKDFTRWVTHEVLPQIHKYGMYLSDKTLTALKRDPEAFERVLKLYADSQSEVRGLRKELESSRPYTNLGLAVLSQKGSVTFQSLSIQAHVLSAVYLYLVPELYGLLYRSR